MDYADDVKGKDGSSKYPSWIIRDAKWVWPIVVMYLPVTFFWALFDMQGSRWTLTATQMDGYWGDVKILPDQIQILNSFFILLFLPLFQGVIYPCLGKCFRMTHLQKMTAGQVIACLAFVMSGFVQLGIQKHLTPVPDYGSDTAIFVTNGGNSAMEVKSPFWLDTEKVNDNGECVGETCTFSIPAEKSRMPTFEWLSKGVQSNVPMTIDDHEFVINSPDAATCASQATTSESCEKCTTDQSTGAIKSEKNSIVNVVYYENAEGKPDFFQVTYQ